MLYTNHYFNFVHKTISILATKNFPLIHQVDDVNTIYHVTLIALDPILVPFLYTISSESSSKYVSDFSYENYQCIK